MMMNDPYSVPRNNHLRCGCYVLIAGAALAVATGHAVTAACQRVLAGEEGKEGGGAEEAEEELAEAGEEAEASRW